MNNLRKICASCACLLLIGCGDPWDKPNVRFDLKKNMEFELVECAFVYIYLNDEVSILPHDYFLRDFTVDDYRKNPDVGVVDKKRGIYVDRILESGVVIRLTDIRETNNGSAGVTYNYYGDVIDGGELLFTDCNITHMLFDRGQGNRTEVYLTKRKGG